MDVANRQDFLACLDCYPDRKGLAVFDAKAKESVVNSPGAPPGFMLVKPGSNRDNFIRRCEGQGFETESL